MVNNGSTGYNASNQNQVQENEKAIIRANQQRSTEQGLKMQEQQKLQASKMTTTPLARIINESTKQGKYRDVYTPAKNREEASSVLGHDLSELDFGIFGYLDQYEFNKLNDREKRKKLAELMPGADEMVNSFDFSDYNNYVKAMTLPQPITGSDAAKGMYDHFVSKDGTGLIDKYEKQSSGFHQPLTTSQKLARSLVDASEGRNAQLSPEFNNLFPPGHNITWRDEVDKKASEERAKLDRQKQEAKENEDLALNERMRVIADKFVPTQDEINSKKLNEEFSSSMDAVNASGFGATEGSGISSETTNQTVPPDAVKQPASPSKPDTTKPPVSPVTPAPATAPKPPPIVDLNKGVLSGQLDDDDIYSTNAVQTRMFDDATKTIQSVADEHGGKVSPTQMRSIISKSLGNESPSEYMEAALKNYEQEWTALNSKNGVQLDNSTLNIDSEAKKLLDRGVSLSGTQAFEEAMNKHNEEYSKRVAAYSDPEYWDSSPAFNEALITVGVALATGADMNTAIQRASEIFEKEEGKLKRNSYKEYLIGQGYNPAFVSSWVESGNKADLGQKKGNEKHGYRPVYRDSKGNTFNTAGEGRAFQGYAAFETDGQGNTIQTTSLVDKPPTPKEAKSTELGYRQFYYDNNGNITLDKNKAANPNQSMFEKLEITPQGMLIQTTYDNESSGSGGGGGGTGFKGNMARDLMAVTNMYSVNRDVANSQASYSFGKGLASVGYETVLGDNLGGYVSSKTDYTKDYKAAMTQQNNFIDYYVRLVTGAVAKDNELATYRANLFVQDESEFTDGINGGYEGSTAQQKHIKQEILLSQASAIQSGDPARVVPMYAVDAFAEGRAVPVRDPENHTLIIGMVYKDENGEVDRDSYEPFDELVDDNYISNFAEEANNRGVREFKEDRGGSR